jgi:hypothetical protein
VANEALWRHVATVRLFMPQVSFVVEQVVHGI